VDFYDKFRYRLVDNRGETANKIGDEYNVITIHHIPSRWITHKDGRFKDEPYCINLIDTPGFYEDKIDKYIADVIDVTLKETLNGLHGIDKILFAEYCYIDQINPGTIQIVKKVLETSASIWGSCIKDRFVFMLTYADARTVRADKALPGAFENVLGTIKSVKVSTSAMFESTDEPQVRRHWRTGLEDFAQLGK